MVRWFGVSGPRWRAVHAGNLTTRLGAGATRHFYGAQSFSGAISPAASRFSRLGDAVKASPQPLTETASLDAGRHRMWWSISPTLGPAAAFRLRRWGARLSVARRFSSASATRGRTWRRKSDDGTVSGVRLRAKPGRHRPCQGRRRRGSCVERSARRPARPVMIEADGLSRDEKRCPVGSTPEHRGLGAVRDCTSPGPTCSPRGRKHPDLPTVRTWRPLPMGCNADDACA